MDYEFHPSSVIIDLIRIVIEYFSQKYTHKSGRSSKMIPINPGEIPKKVPYRMARPRTSVYGRPPPEVIKNLVPVNAEKRYP